MIWCWREGAIYKFSQRQPRLSSEIELYLRDSSAIFAGDVGTFCVTADRLENIAQSLPVHGEVRQIVFHDLWSTAVGKPGYNKAIWKQMAKALGE